MKTWGIADICTASIVPTEDYLRRLSRLVHAVISAFQPAKLETVTGGYSGTEQGVTPGNFVLELWAAVFARALVIR